MKKRILAVTLAVGLLFGGIAVQAAENAHTHDYVQRVTTNVTGAYTHTYIGSDGATKTCDVLSGTEIHQIVCSICGDVQQTWTTTFSNRHTTNHD